MPDFATRLRELRKERRLRQQDLADAFGTAQTTIANYENKLRFPDESMLGRLAEYFDVSLDYLMGRSNAKHKTQDWTLRAEDIPEAPLSASSDAARYLGLVRQGDSYGAAQLVESLTRGPLGIRRTYLEVLEPALKEVGRLWAHGELSVAEEHVISHATERIMSRVFAVEGAPREVTAEANLLRPGCFQRAAPDRSAHGLGFPQARWLERCNFLAGTWGSGTSWRCSRYGP